MSFESKEPCVVCNREGEGFVCSHHLFTRKVYPEFQHEEWNKIPVCQRCHNQFHNKGTSWMANKYLSVHLWLIRNDWFFCEYVNKWRREGF